MSGTALVLLGCFGLAYIVGYSKISLPIRLLLGGGGTDEVPTQFVPAFGRPGLLLCALVECAACFGFWEGLILGAGHRAGCWVLPISFSSWLFPYAFAFVVCGFNFVIGRFVRIM